MQSSSFSPRSLYSPQPMFRSNSNTFSSPNLTTTFLLPPPISSPMSSARSTESIISGTSSRTSVGSSNVSKKRKIIVLFPKCDERKPLDAQSRMNDDAEVVEEGRAGLDLDDFSKLGGIGLKVLSREMHFDEKERLNCLPPTIEIFLPGQAAWSDYYYPSSDEGTNSNYNSIYQQPIFYPTSAMPPSSSQSSRRNSGITSNSTLPPRLQKAYNSRHQQSKFNPNMLSKSMGAVPNYSSPEMIRGRSLTLLELSRGFNVEEIVTRAQMVQLNSKEMRNNHSGSSYEGEDEKESTTESSKGVYEVQIPLQDDIGADRGSHRVSPDFSFPPRSTPSSSPFATQTHFPPSSRTRALSATASTFIYTPTTNNLLIGKEKSKQEEEEEVCRPKIGFRFPSQHASTLGNTEASDEESEMESEIDDEGEFESNWEENQLQNKGELETAENNNLDQFEGKEITEAPSIFTTPRKIQGQPHTVNSTPSDLSAFSPYSIRQASTVRRAPFGKILEGEQDGLVDHSPVDSLNGFSLPIRRNSEGNPSNLDTFGIMHGKSRSSSIPTEEDDPMPRIVQFLENQFQNLQLFLAQTNTEQIDHVFGTLTKKIEDCNEKMEGMMLEKFKGLEKSLNQRFDSITSTGSSPAPPEDLIQAEILRLEIKYLKYENMRLSDLINNPIPTPMKEWKYPSPPTSPELSRNSTAGVNNNISKCKKGTDGWYSIEMSNEQ